MNTNLEGLPAILEGVTLTALLPALIYLICGLILVKIVMRMIRSGIESSAIDKTLHRFILTLIKITLYFIVFMTVAAELGIQITSFVAILSVAGLAISLSLQGLLSNFSSGVLILSVKPFVAGDYIEVGGTGGTVKGIGFVYTVVSTPDNKTVFIPNSEVTSSKITNYSGDGHRRVDLMFTADYACPVKDVLAALKDAAGTLPAVLSDPAPLIRVEAYQESAVQYCARVWCNSADYWDVYYDMIEAVPAAYERHGVKVSYPHVNVHMVKD